MDYVFTHTGKGRIIKLFIWTLRLMRYYRREKHYEQLPSLERQGLQLALEYHRRKPTRDGVLDIYALVYLALRERPKRPQPPSFIWRNPYKWNTEEQQRLLKNCTAYLTRKRKR